ncbi:hypothetical protein C8R45DRAFT_422741 [Mycena sanguinolenta]|nr:hypothetical protein C8R45DRAFT_422741 [Mycena sanguinolenta]
MGSGSRSARIPFALLIICNIPSSSSGASFGRTLDTSRHPDHFSIPIEGCMMRDFLIGRYTVVPNIAKFDHDTHCFLHIRRALRLHRGHQSYIFTSFDEHSVALVPKA